MTEKSKGTAPAAPAAPKVQVTSITAVAPGKVTPDDPRVKALVAFGLSEEDAVRAVAEVNRMW